MAEAKASLVPLQLKDADALNEQIASALMVNGSIILAWGGDIVEFSEESGSMLRRASFDGPGRPSCVAMCPIYKGPIADTVYALMTDWSLVALQRDKSEMWEKRYLMGPNLKRFKEKPLTKAFAAVSPRHPVIYFANYGEQSIRGYSLVRALPRDLRAGLESDKERKAGPTPLKFRVDTKAGICGLACHPIEPTLYVLFLDGSIRAYDLESQTKKNALHAAAVFTWGTAPPADKKPLPVPYVPSSLVTVHLPGGRGDRCLLVSIGSGKVVVGEVSSGPRLGGALLGTGSLPSSDFLPLGVHVDTSSPACPTVLVPMRKGTDPALSIAYAHINPAAPPAQESLTWRSLTVAGGHLDRGPAATAFASDSGILMTHALGGQGSTAPTFFRVQSRGPSLRGSLLRALSAAPLPGGFEESVARAGAGARNPFLLGTTFTWAEHGFVCSYSWQQNRPVRLFGLPGSDREPLRVLELHHSRKQVAWLVFFEGAVAGQEGGQRWTIVTGSMLSAGGGGSEGAVGRLDSEPWVSVGLTGTFLGPDDEHFAILGPDRASLLVFDTATTNGELPPLMTLRFPQGPLRGGGMPDSGPCSLLFPGPAGSNDEQVVWVDEAASTLSLSRPLISREPNLLGAAAGPMPVAAERFLVLSRGESVQQVLWQGLVPRLGSDGEVPVGAVITSERVLLVNSLLEVLAEHRPAPDDKVRNLGRPFLSATWLGPTLLVLDAALQVSAVAWDGEAAPLCQLAKGAAALSPVLAAALPDRVLVAYQRTTSRTGPCAPRVQVAVRPTNTVAAMVIGWCSLSQKGLLPGGPAALKERIRPLLKSWDIVRGSNPQLLSGAIRHLAHAGLRPLAAQLSDRGRETLGDLATSCYLASGLWGPATRAAAEAPGRWLPLAEEAAGQGEFTMAQRCLVHGGEGVAALMLAYWGGEVDAIKALTQRGKKIEAEWALPGMERPLANPSFEPILPHVARELVTGAAAAEGVISAPPVGQLEQMSRLANGADVAGGSIYLPSLGAVPGMAALPYGLVLFGEAEPVAVPPLSHSSMTEGAGPLGLPDLEPDFDRVPWLIRAGQGPPALDRLGSLRASEGARMSMGPSAAAADTGSGGSATSPSGAGPMGFGVDSQQPNYIQQLQQQQMQGPGPSGLARSSGPAMEGRSAAGSDSSGDEGYVAAPQRRRINIVIRPRDEPTPAPQAAAAGPASSQGGTGDLRQAVAGLKLGPGLFGRRERRDSDASDTSSALSAPSSVGPGNFAQQQQQQAQGQQRFVPRLHIPG